MPYHTITTFRDAIGEHLFMGLVDHDGDGVVGADDERRFLQRAASASSKLDSYIGNVYPVPLAADSVTAALLEADRNVLVYLLADDGDFMSETIANKYKDAIQWARDVSCKKAQLGVTAAEPSPRISGVRRNGAAPALSRRNVRDLL